MITHETLKKRKKEGGKITMLTCYDASFAAILDAAGVDVLLVGDSLGMVIQGETSTLPVNLDAMCYHTRAVARGAKNAMVLADLPFGAYEASPEDAFLAASQLLKNGATMVKLEGGAQRAATTRFLQSRGIPVCAHIGLTPQAVNMLGGYKVQGREQEAARELTNAAAAHDAAGVSMLVMECVPADLAKQITQESSCPTVGIGAGVNCDGQVLVLYDMLGLYPGHTPKFAKNFMTGKDSVAAAVKSYVDAVKKGSFPDAEHSFL